MFSFDFDCPIRGPMKNAPYMLQLSQYGTLSASGLAGQVSGCCGSFCFFKGDEEYFKRTNKGVQLLISDKIMHDLESTSDYTYVIVPTSHGIIHVKLNVGGYDSGDDDWLPKSDVYRTEMSEDFYNVATQTIYRSLGTLTKEIKKKESNHKICAIYLSSQPTMFQQTADYYTKTNPEIDKEWLRNPFKKTAELFDPGDILVFITTTSASQGVLLASQLLALGNYTYLYESDYVYNGNYLRDEDGEPRLKLHIIEKG